MQKTLVTILFLFLLTQNTFSAVTQFMGDSNIKEFEKGKFKNIALDRNGHLSLSPNTKEVFKKEDILFVWSSAMDSKGNLYFGTGNKSRIYRQNKAGKVELFYDTDKGTSITTLAIDSDDNIYAAINPVGTIIKINRKGISSTFKQLTEKYIWKLKVDSKGNLYVATGSSAAIYKISPAGEKKELFKADDESHFLCFDIVKNNLYFASEGKGIVYKLDLTSNKVKVLYDSYENEIKDLIADFKGNIYFCTASKIHRTPPKNFNYTDTFILYGSQSKAKSKKFVRTTKKAPLKNSIYKIDNKGQITKLFTRDNTIFLSLTMDNKGNLYAGSGDYGIIYKIKGINDASIFIDTKELQVLSLITHKKNQLIAGTGNVGKVFNIGLEYSNEGVFISRVFNSNGNATWGKITWETENDNGSNITLMTRAGNTTIPDKTWTPWSKKYSNNRGENIENADNQYMQYKAIISSEKQSNSPLLKKVTISYLLENRTPLVENIKLKKEKNKRLSLVGPFSQELPPSVYTVSWSSSDQDYDFLSYSIYFRKENSSDYILLKDQVYAKYYSFDSRRIPDGNYYVKVFASDVKSNGKNRMKIGFAESSLYKIDNSPPKVLEIKISKNSRGYVIRGKVKDDLSMIKVVQYSLNGQDWVYLGPKDRIYDSRKESFEITINPRKTKLMRGSNIIMFRVADAFNNFVTQEATFGAEVKK